MMVEDLSDMGHLVDEGMSGSEVLNGRIERAVNRPRSMSSDLTPVRYPFLRGFLSPFLEIRPALHILPFEPMSSESSRYAGRR